MDRYQLIPELKDWDAHNGGEESFDGWTSCMGSYSLAVGYASLLWPQFVEVKGMVFRGQVDDSVLDSWLAGHSKRSVEATLNHLHLLDVQHPGVWAEATEAQLRYLGETLKAAWSAKLALDFPTRRFVVEYIQGTLEAPREHQVVFYELREAEAHE
ncbi:MAG: hypothetical protein ACK5OA_01010 [Acidovorax sp.]